MHNEEDPSRGIEELSQQLSEDGKEDIRNIMERMVERDSKPSQDKSEELKAKAAQIKKDKQAIEASREPRVEGGSMLIPPEMEVTEEEMPLDTYTPDEQAMAEQVPDEEMEDSHLDFILGETLDESEQDYLMNALDADPKLNDIFDRVITSASEFSGEGEVEGPGTGVSDSIPARLSDGEFVVTEQATDEIGADNLQTMMDDAEREADAHGGGVKERYAGGGLLDNPESPYGTVGGVPVAEDENEEIHKSMLGANRMPSVAGSRR
jgi:hypothetical protein